MRRMRLALGALVAVSALTLMVSPALAKKEEPVREFEASSSGTVKSTSLGIQQFTFSFAEKFKYKIKCEEAKGSGEITPIEGKATSFTDKIRFSSCTTSHKGAVLISAFELQFNSNGTFTILNEPKVRIPTAKCVFVVDSQTVGEESRRKPVTYANKGEEAARKLEIKTKVQTSEHGEANGIEFEPERGCEEIPFKSEGGVWKGNMLAELEGGTIGIHESAPDVRRARHS